MTLTIGSGELVAIIGASGSGKTTLLDTLCGLRSPAAGSVRLVSRTSATCQDDIIHLALPLARTLRYTAARGRRPAPARVVCVCQGSPRPGWRQRVNQQDQQAIEGLFKQLYQETAQGGPRDAAAEALIQRLVQQAPPGLLYQMAQRMVAQQYTINQLRAQAAAAPQAGGAPAGFAPPPGARYQRGSGQQGYQQPGPYYQQGGWQQPGRQGGGFLAGAGQLALGIGGGILGAEVLTSIFDGVGNMFDGDRDRQDYDEGFRDGFVDGQDDDNRDQGDYQNQDPGGYDGGYDDGGFDGGFDDGGGIF